MRSRLQPDGLPSDGLKTSLCYGCRLMVKGLVSALCDCTLIVMHVLSYFIQSSLITGKDVAQMVECWTGTLLRQVRFPGVARDFSLRQLSVQTVLYTPVCNCMH